MVSRSYSDDEAMSCLQHGEGGPELGESRMELGETNHGRLSVVLCHQCQTVHYELKCNAASSLSQCFAEREQASCRNSITWDEFFGSSLELAPSLLNIYDNLANSTNDNDDDTVPTSPSATPQSARHHAAPVNQHHSCVTPSSPGFWVTDRGSHQRLFVRSCPLPGGLPGRPVSMMEPPRESGADTDNVKKRPLSISSLSSVSSTSLPRLQHKRPNLTQDPEGSCCSDHTSHTSSDSYLTGAISDRVSMTSDRVSLTSDPVSLASDRVSLVSTEDAGAGVAESRSEVDGGESSVDPVNYQYQGLADSRCGAQSLELPTQSLELPTGSSQQSLSASSRASSSSSMSTSPTIQPDSENVTLTRHNEHAGQVKPAHPATVPVSQSGEEASKNAALVMKPLQTTTRPVVISLPESIRKHRSSSSCVDSDRWAGQGKVEESGETPRRSSSATPGYFNSGKTPPSSNEERPLTGRASFSGSPSSVVSNTSLTKDASSPLSPSSSSPAPFSPSTPRTSVLLTPLATRAGSTPPQPLPVQALSQHSSASPLSPTALARRRFLASHFDLPDVPPHLEEPPKEADAGEDEGVHSPADAAPATPPGRRSASLTVPASLSLRKKNDVSPMSSPSGSASSAMHSPCDGSDGTRVTSQGDASRSSEAAGASPSSSRRARTSQPSSPVEVEQVSGPSSPPTRGRSHKRAEVGSGSGRRGSVKGGSYVTYVQRVVAEIVDTERMYVDSLEAIIKGYLEPLKNMLSSSPTGTDDLTCLFCNITDIYAFGKVFLSDLEQCGLDPVKVAECFVKHNNGFVIYTDYCTNYPRAVEVLTRFMQDSDLNEVCKACQQSLGHGLPLGAYLLRPVQRILKYHLLLQNILKNFDKSRAGYSMLEQALEHMTSMAHHINEMKRRHEHAVRIQEVQSQLEDYSGEDLTRLGELVLEGSFRVYGAKASRQVFLFEKGILISKKKEGGMLTCKASVPCSNLMLVEVIPNEPLSFHIIPFDNPRAQHTLQARSMEQKRHWCQEIKRLILESYKGRIPDNVKSLVMELGRNHDNDYVGKDTHDSPWKHQHTAPEYLEKRRFRRKSGGKGPDVGPLLKLPKSGTKRDQASGNKNKSPKVWRKSDSKLTNVRQRAESLPRMLASASNLPGLVLGATKPVRSESFNRQKSTSTSQKSPYAIPDGNNNRNKSFNSHGGSSAPGGSPDWDEAKDDESIQRRTHSFKRAMRFQPVYSQDLTDIVPTDVPMIDDNSGGKAGEVPATPGHRHVSNSTKNTHQDQARKEGKALNGYRDGSSPSDSEDSSDTDNNQRHVRKGRKDRNNKLGMYSSLPALNSLERKPAQKRRPGETKSGMRAKQDLSKSSDSLAGGSDGTGTAETSTSRQYRRRWEGTEAGLQKKVPALHDTYERRSRENLLRKKGKSGADRKSSSGAKLTDWGSVDKLTHGSMSDLSHLKEDPWVKLSDSPAPSPSPHSKNAPLSVTKPANAHYRSHSMSFMQSRDWNPGLNSVDLTRPRNYSDVSDIVRKSGKENLDWMVYLKRNQGDQDMRERANSLSQMRPRSRASPCDLSTKPLCDANTRISRSTSLCKDTLKRYSLDLSDKEFPMCVSIPSDAPKQTGTDERAGGVALSSDRQGDKSQSSVDDDVEMVEVNSSRGLSPPKGQSEQCNQPLQFTSIDTAPPSPSPSSNISPGVANPCTTPVTPPAPRTQTTVHQLLSPTSYPPKWPENTQVTPSDPPISPTGDQSLTPTAAEYQISRRPLSPKTAALSAEGERMVAEMERYYEVNSPKTPTLAFKFPSPVPPSPPKTEETISAGSSMNQANINRLSGVSSVSSSSAEGYLYSLREINPNRLSGVSTISTSSYESQNSNSSDSLVGTLKNKLSVWTHKLGGRRSREEDLAHTPSFPTSRESLPSPKALKSHHELHDVLREHSLGSPLIGSRMANTLPVGFEPLLSPSSAANDQTMSSYEFSSKEGTPEPPARFSFPSAAAKQSKESPEVFPASGPVQQSDSGISMYSGDSSNARPRQGKASTLPANLQSLQQFPCDADKMEDRKRRDSASSTDSCDSFYERRLSVAFETSTFQDQGMFGAQEGEPQSPSTPRLGPRKSIREVVQFIEEKFKPHQPQPVEVKRKEPSALIRQRLLSLRANSAYKRRMGSRSVSEDRGRGRERSPESPRIPRPENRSRSFNQFMHRVQPQQNPDAKAQQMERDRNWEVAARREQELASRVAHDQGEERSEGEGSTSMSGSMDRLDQLSTDVNNLVIMRGWVRNLINKFQQIT